jgi:hypothetical protein
LSSFNLFKLPSSDPPTRSPPHLSTPSHQSVKNDDDDENDDDDDDDIIGDNTR